MLINERSACDVKRRRERVAEFRNDLTGARSRYCVGCKLE